MIVSGCNDCLHLWCSTTPLNLNTLLFITEKRRVVCEGEWEMDEVSHLLWQAPHHSQSLCDYNDWPVKFVFAVNTSVVLSIFHIATDIDQFPQDRIPCEQGRGMQTCCTIMNKLNVSVSQGKKHDCKDYVLCTLPDQNTDVFMYSLLWHVTPLFQILLAYMDSQ